MSTPRRTNRKCQRDFDDVVKANAPGGKWMPVEGQPVPVGIAPPPGCARSPNARLVRAAARDWLADHQAFSTLNSVTKLSLDSGGWAAFR